jgi:hypothetical protein
MIHFADPGYELLVLRIFKEIKEKKRQFCINLLRVTQPCRYSKGLSKKKTAVSDSRQWTNMQAGVGASMK